MSNRWEKARHTGDRGHGEQRGGERRRKRREQESAEDESMYEWGKKEEGGKKNGEGGEGGEVEDEGKKQAKKKVKPNMERSGKLQAEALKTESGVVLKFADPPEAKLPKKKWRLYPFKGEQPLGLFLHLRCCSIWNLTDSFPHKEVIPAHHQASYLFGRNRAVLCQPRRICLPHLCLRMQFILPGCRHPNRSHFLLKAARGARSP